ncbi:hypothetical protein [Hymenobacter sp. AT01-02]|uniref:hypothetical protein n=1 Tax=Hymenobacter sp. AT01-02 TaxID=1571877 RepID=UPI0006973C63|nr:hypothetical protein [Hymenobacter sp. AT01-02]
MKLELPMAARFQDQNLVRGHFLKRITVQCPSCQKRAEIETDLETYHSVFRCSNCHHHLAKDLVYYDLSLKVYCNQCAHRIILEIPEVKTKKQAIKVRCPECGDVQSYQPSYTQHVGYSIAIGAHDPFFGLPLWYQEPFKDQLLWTYNPEHLLYLEQYVGAKLRERNARRYMTIVEKLPQFIKAAKNREAILKRLQQMKLKA